MKLCEFFECSWKNFSCDRQRSILPTKFIATHADSLLTSYQLHCQKNNSNANCDAIVLTPSCGLFCFLYTYSGNLKSLSMQQGRYLKFLYAKCLICIYFTSSCLCVLRHHTELVASHRAERSKLNKVPDYSWSRQNLRFSIVNQLVFGVLGVR